MSHLLQMRGLKRSFENAPELGKVASFTDAWIETKRGTTTREIGKSHLLQMRGLKRARAFSEKGGILSHLLQMRGLKPSPGGIAKKLLRRIFYRCVD